MVKGKIKDYENALYEIEFGMYVSLVFYKHAFLIGKYGHGGSTVADIQVEDINVVYWQSCCAVGQVTIFRKVDSEMECVVCVQQVEVRIIAICYLNVTHIMKNENVNGKKLKMPFLIQCIIA